MLIEIDTRLLAVVLTSIILFFAIGLGISLIDYFKEVDKRRKKKK